MNSLNSFSCEHKVICFCQVSTVSHTNCVRVRMRVRLHLMFVVELFKVLFLI